jgi:hypothetical protein
VSGNEAVEEYTWQQMVLYIDQWMGASASFSGVLIFEERGPQIAVILPLYLCYKQLERFDIDLYRIFLTCYVRDISYHWQQPGTSYILLNTATIQLRPFLAIQLTN